MKTCNNCGQRFVDDDDTIPSPFERLEDLFGGNEGGMRDASLCLSVIKVELVVVSQLSNMNRVFGNFIDEPVLVRYSPGPVAGESVF